MSVNISVVLGQVLWQWLIHYESLEGLGMLFCCGFVGQVVSSADFIVFIA
jgi:hypothetical protein